MQEIGKLEEWAVIILAKCYTKKEVDAWEERWKDFIL